MSRAVLQVFEEYQKAVSPSFSKKRKTISNRTIRNKPSRSFSTFSQSFSTFSGLFGPVFTHSDTFGYIRMLSAIKFSQKKIEKQIVFDNFVKFFLCFCPFSEELRIFGRHQQLPRHFLLQIDLFGARYDPWSSSWDGVPSWDGLRERHWPAPGRSCWWGGCRPSPDKFFFSDQAIERSSARALERSF